ncbi:MAG: hypothetical protein J6581_06025 [Apibacter sp.]|nr:hypothetical protein [Apibacter sp.]
MHSSQYHINIYLEKLIIEEKVKKRKIRESGTFVYLYGETLICIKITYFGG